MIKSESIAKIALALLEAQKNMGNATKESKNPFFKSTYADLNSVREAVTPALNAAGITVMQPTMLAADGTAVVETTLLHSSGEFLVSQFPIVSSKQNDPQAFGSAVSYARRYGLQSFLSVGAVDDDGEADMGRKTFTTKPVALAESLSQPLTAGPALTAAKKISFSKNALKQTEDDI